MSDNNSESVEQIRKVFARDLKVGEPVHTVFRAAGKQKNTSRSGKSFLALTLADKTGTVDARVFENIEAADQAFNDGDYLLLAGRVVSFHGKAQVVIDRLERLDPAPMDPREFTPPPAPEPKAGEAPKPAEAARPGAEPRPPRKGGNARGRLLAILEDPTVAAGLDALLHHLEQHIEERVSARVQAALARAGQSPSEPREPREPRRSRGQRAEVRRSEELAKSDPHKPAAPPRDPSLPKEFAFKPFNLLTTSEPAAPPAAAEPAKAPEGA